MPTLTPNYSLNKPLVNDPTDADQWGTQLNANMDTLDTTVKSVSDKANLASPAINAQSANYTVLATDQNKLITVDATGGSRTITLLAAATAGSGFKIGIKKIDISTNTVIIDANASETIDGALTYTLSNQYEDVYIISNGTNWYIEDTLSQQVITNTMTAVNSTSGTSIDFTGIKTGVRRVIIMFSGVSLAGTSQPRVQLGTSSTPQTTGYSGVTALQITGTSVATLSSGFDVNSGYASSLNTYTGTLTLTYITTNTWVADGNLAILVGATGLNKINGVVTLSGELDMVRITSVSGADTFDAGIVNVQYSL